MAREAVDAVEDLGGLDGAARSGQGVWVGLLRVAGKGNGCDGGVGLNGKAPRVLFDKALEKVRDEPVGPEDVRVDNDGTARILELVRLASLS